MTKALQQVEVRLVDGKPMVSSLKVAQHFGKKHKHVLEAIKKLEIPENFREPNFRLSEYELETSIGQVRKYPMYLMTRDGFVLLVMGFTGKKAMQWKLRYIEAFNAMEKKLKEGIKEVSEDMIKLTYEGETVVFSRNAVDFFEDVFKWHKSDAMKLTARALADGSFLEVNTRQMGIKEVIKTMEKLTRTQNKIWKKVVKYREAGLKIKEIAKLLDVSKETVSRTCKILRQAGWEV